MLLNRAGQGFMPGGYAALIGDSYHNPSFLMIKFHGFYRSFGRNALAT
jgi:hypothetical protein